MSPKIDPDDFEGPPKFGDTFASKNDFVDAIKDYVTDSGSYAIQRKCAPGKAKVICKNAREPVFCPFTVTAEEITELERWCVPPACAELRC